MHRGDDAAVHPALRVTHQLRGWLVGVVSAVTGPTAHAAAIGMMPDSDALLVVVACCAGFGWGVAALSRVRPGWVATLALLGGAQMFAHLALLVLTGGHGHALTSTMLGLHALATLVAAAAVQATEPAVVGVLTTILRLVRAVLGPPPAESALLLVGTPLSTDLRDRLRARAPLDTRGPPLPAEHL